MRVFNYVLVIATILILSACELSNSSSEDEETNNNDNSHEESVVFDEEMLLEQSYLAMQKVTSLYMATELNVIEQYEGEEKVGYRTFDVAMILEEPYSQHYVIHIDDDIAEHYVSGEVYEVGEATYFHSSGNEVEWEYFENESTVQRLAREIQENDKEEYLSYSEQFEITDETDGEYVLTYHGELEDVINVFYGGAIDMFEKVQMSMAPADIDRDVTEFDFKMMIDKETFFVNSYEMYIKLGSTESEDYVFESDYIITFDSFNEYGEIEVPQDIIDSAIEFTEEEEGDINPVRSELPTDLPRDFPLPEQIEIDYYEEYTDESEYYIIINFFFDEDHYDEETYKNLVYDYSQYAETVDFTVNHNNEIEHEEGDLLSFMALLPQSEVNERNHFAVNLFSQGSIDKAKDSAFGKIHWRMDK